MTYSSTSMQFKARLLNMLAGLPSLGMGLALLLLFLGLAAPARAQLDTGTISGVVTDPAGKVVQGAAVTANETTTGTTYSTTSNNTGNYSFPSVRTGTYEIKVSVTGFKNAVYTGVTVSVGSSSTQDIALAVGSATEVVSVTGGTVNL